MTWANQVRILKQNFEQLASVIGGTLINAFKPVVKAVNSAMGAIIAFAKTISNALGQIFGWTYEESGGGFAQEFDNAAAGAGAIEDATGGAADNIKKMQAGLRAFDELKVINMPDNNQGGSGGGGGGTGGAGGGAEAAGGKWVQGESILEKYKSDIDTLYKLGEHIGKTLTDAMNNIDWDSVYRKAENFGKGLADFLNGLISPELFGATGRTIAGALNTAIHAALAFGETFDWEDFGLSIATGINEFFKTFKADKLAKTINTWIKGALKTATTMLKKTDFKMIGEKIGEFLTEIDWIGNLKAVGELIWEAIKSALYTWTGVFDAAPIETTIITSIAVLKWTGLGEALYKGMISALKLQFGVVVAKIGNAIMSLLPMIIPYVTRFFSGLNPGMIGEIGIWIEKQLSGTIFDTSTWTGVFKDIDDLLWEIAYAIGNAAEKIVIWIGTSITEIFQKVFNFDQALSIFDTAGQWFSKIKEDFENKDWLGIGKDIVMGILNGIGGVLMGIAEPFIDLFNWTWDCICDVFGIHSPAKNMEPIGENIVLGIISGFKAFAGNFILSIQQWWSESIVPWFTFDRWAQLGLNIQNALSEKWNEIAQNASEKWAEIKASVTGETSGLKKHVSKDFESIKEKMERVMRSSRENTGVEWNGIRQDSISNMENLKGSTVTIFSGIDKSIRDTWANVKANTQNSMDETSKKIAETGNTINASNSTTWETIKSTISNAGNAIKSSVSGSTANVRSNVINEWNAIKSNTNSSWNANKMQINNSWNSIRANTLSATSAMKSNVSTSWSSLKNTTNSSWRNIKLDVSDSVRSVKNTIKSEMGNAENGWENAWNSIFGTTDNILGNIKGNVSSAMDSISGMVSSISGALDGLFSKANSASKITVSSKGGSGGTVNKKTRIGTSGVNTAAFQNANIPAFATGGITMKHTFAEIGEYNRPEAILPLTNDRAMGMIAESIYENYSGGVAESGLSPDVIERAIYTATYNAVSAAINNSSTMREQNRILEGILEKPTMEIGQLNHALAKDSMLRGGNYRGGDMSRLAVAEEIYR